MSLRDFPHPAVRLPLLLSLFAVACGSDGKLGGGAPAKAVDGPLYAISTSILTSDSSTSYLTTAGSLDKGPAVSLDDAIEFGDSARAYGRDGTNVVYVTSSEDAIMTEVTFDASGTGHRGRTLSFSNLGLSATTGGNVNYHISATKAYFVSQDLAQIIIWNPHKMTYERTVELPFEASPGAADIVFYPRPIVVGHQLVLVATTYDANDIPLGLVVNVVDTDADRVVSSTLETRCHDLLQSAVDANGDRYFASSDYAAAQHLLIPSSPGPCMLRMRGGETGFDPDWSRTLTGDLETPLWTGVTQGAGGTVYVQGTDATTKKITALDDAYEITIAQPWSWYALDGGDAAPTPVDVGMQYPPSFPPMSEDGNDYVTIWDGENSTLVNLTSPGTPRAGLVVPGFLYNVVRIR
ncbi:MAG TPA: hypothetical protein VHC69_04110 [Polyangiaceae bacterium]|nr:hypothetical protein [Polyangiaceae bacterium]